MTIADRCVVCDDDVSCHAHGQIRQFISGRDVGTHSSLHIHNQKLRLLCERRGASTIEVPGGLEQVLCNKGYILVADHCITGTRWFKLPIEVARHLDYNKFSGLKEAVESYDEIWEMD